jgi:hypothetical protein
LGNQSLGSVICLFVCQSLSANERDPSKMDTCTEETGDFNTYVVCYDAQQYLP